MGLRSDTTSIQYDVFFNRDTQHYLEKATQYRARTFIISQSIQKVTLKQSVNVKPSGVINYFLENLNFVRICHY